jgi:hypothetical protein
VDNVEQNGPPALSNRDWHEFATTLGWFAVPAASNESRRFEMSDGDTVMVKPRAALDILAAFRAASQASKE